ncbi:excalibur calcium-binding domain-containing protein [Arthrobacter sp. CDRTa11]|uniref:excalibur calcium-binding domain-containing protein n=1 Tax=Arthrobacter sp. CDRTa11 TaxID=2651199 RepID=UPI002265E65E|nr:excalibur calcium-binding domain-containing protein [Arthrobacter sp. CDRTa11]
MSGDPLYRPTLIPAKVLGSACSSRDAGAAPVGIGQPEYGAHLDRDGGSVGCE